jgi:hypothetical protein
VSGSVPVPTAADVRHVQAPGNANEFMTWDTSRTSGRPRYTELAEPVLPGGVLRRAIRLVLHQPQPPTATTGTTYSIEMYQCIRHASGAIAANLSRAFPLLLHVLGSASRARGYQASREASPGPPAGAPAAVPSSGIRARRLRTNSTNSSPASAIATPSTITPIDAFELSGVQYS